MSLLRNIASGLRSLFRGQQFDLELDASLDSHVSAVVNRRKAKFQFWLDPAAMYVSNSTNLNSMSTMS